MLLLGKILFYIAIANFPFNSQQLRDRIGTDEDKALQYLI